MFSKLKSKTEFLDRTNVIYKIPCDGIGDQSCPLSYVGQTKNQLKKRLAQHNNDLKNKYNPNGQSAVVSHFFEHGHKPAFDKASVLCTENLWHRRNTLESLHIFCEDTYNLRRDTQDMAA